MTSLIKLTIDGNGHLASQASWNGYYYDTEGYVQTMSSKLGVATNPQPAKIYSLPSQNPNRTVVVEVDTPIAKMSLQDEYLLGQKHCKFRAIG